MTGPAATAAPVPALAPYMLQKDFALNQGWAKSYVTKLKQQGRLVMTADGYVDTTASLALIRQTTGAPERAAEAVVSAGFSDSRDRKEHYAAELARLEFEQRVGKLLPAADVHSAVADAATTLRSRLQSLPAQLAPQLAALTDEGAISVLLTDQIELLLSEMADAVAHLVGEGAAA